MRLSAVTDDRYSWNMVSLQRLSNTVTEFRLAIIVDGTVSEIERIEIEFPGPCT
jgi:hypothetical protein